MIVRVNVRKVSRKNARGNTESDLKIETDNIAILLILKILDFF
jgi:hypothetical protein